jgi:WD40 repeat protein
MDGSLWVWNLKSWKQIEDDRRDRDIHGRVQAIALSPDRKEVVGGSYDGAVRLWDADTDKVIVK